MARFKTYDLKCQKCGGAFSVRNRFQMFCARACYIESGMKGGRKRRDVKRCSGCGADFRPRWNLSRHQRFCSKVCAGQYRTAHRPPNKLDNHGYVVVVGPSKGQRFLEHRLVMERILGRPLARHELVHHKNGQRSDNRPANLELCDRRQPPSQRVEDKIDWCILYLEEHGYSVSSPRDLMLEIPCGVTMEG